MRHPSLRSFSAALLIGAIALGPLQGCKRLDMVSDVALNEAPPSSVEEDNALTDHVRVALARSPLIHSSNIGVQSHGGVVLLTGMAADPTQIDLAMFVAQNVPGVSLVTSFMFASSSPTETVVLNTVSAGTTPRIETTAQSASLKPPARP